MTQINFRVDDDIKSIIELISKTRGISSAEFAKRATINEISQIRIDIAFDLLEQGKIGRKRAWTISGLSSHEFLREWTNRNAEEKLSNNIVEKELKLLNVLDIKKFQK